MLNAYFKKKKEAENCVVYYLNNRTFTACGVGYSCLLEKDFKRFTIFQGKTSLQDGSDNVISTTFFDVASLTKPLVTVLSFLALIKEGKTSLEEKLESLLERKVPQDKKNIQLVDLIGHQSGFPSHKPYFQKLTHVELQKKKEIVLEYILNEKLEYIPKDRYIYSDIDYILLGIIIEKKSGMKLEQFWKSKITDPLHISDEFQFYSLNKEKNVVSTGFCPWSDKKLEGIVHDDNCRAIESMCGHAGLFSTVNGIVSLCENIVLQIKTPYEHPSIQKKDLCYLLDKKKSGDRVIGFDIPSGEKPASGEYFSENTIGHLGFTGTSFWIDLEKKIVIVLLTNRVIFGENTEKIKKMRPHLHNVLMSN